MVNTTRPLQILRVATGLYAMAVLAAVGTLVALSVTDPALATAAAWGHAVVVAVFLPLLVLRVRGVAAGKSRAATFVMVIGCVVGAVNLVEALLPRTFPVWMRAQMLAIVVIMCVIAVMAYRLHMAKRACPGPEKRPQ